MNDGIRFVKMVATQYNASDIIRIVDLDENEEMLDFHLWIVKPSQSKDLKRTLITFFSIYLHYNCLNLVP